MQVGDAQAIPDNLYDYSDQTTRANSDLQTWIRNVLTSVVTQYQETSIDLGDGIRDLTLPGYTSIDNDALTCLTQAFSTDRHVHEVGQAFQNAGDNGRGSVQFPPFLHNHLPAGQDPDQYGTITTSDSVITANISQIDTGESEQQGQQLEQYIKAHGISSYVLQQLKVHQNDPDYMAGLINSMSPAQLQGFLTHFSDDDKSDADREILVNSLIAAYASSQLTSSAENVVAQWLLNTADIKQIDATLRFLVDIRSNPQAALNFIDSLSQQEFDELASGLYFNFDGSGTGEPPDIAASFSALFLNVCTSALQAMNDPNQMKKFMDRVYDAYQDTDPSDLTDIIPALHNLLALFATKLFSNPPVNDQPDGTTKGQLFTDWIQQQSQLLATYDKEFAQWIYNTDAANNTNNAAERSMIENMLAAAGLALFPVDLPAAVPLAMFEAAVVGWLQPAVDSYVNDMLTGGGPDPEQAMQAFLGAEEFYAKLQLASALFGEGQLVLWEDGQEVPITLESTGCTNDDQLLNWVMNHSNMVVVLSGTGGQKTLSDLLNAVGNQDSPNPGA